MAEMNREQFIVEMKHRHGREAIANIQEHSTVVECDCGEEACLGWRWRPLPFAKIYLPDEWQEREGTE